MVKIVQRKEKQMEFPKTMVIGPCEFTVDFVDKLLDDDNSTKLNGHIRWDETTIEIENSTSYQTKMLILMHEIIHGCDHYSDAELTEKQVELIANQLMCVLKNNPEFVEMFR